MAIEELPQHLNDRQSCREAEESDRHRKSKGGRGGGGWDEVRFGLNYASGNDVGGK